MLFLILLILLTLCHASNQTVVDIGSLIYLNTDKLFDFINNYPCYDDTAENFKIFVDAHPNTSKEDLIKQFGQINIYSTFVSYNNNCYLTEQSKIANDYTYFSCAYKYHLDPYCYSTWSSFGNSMYGYNLIIEQNVFGKPRYVFINETVDNKFKLNHTNIYQTYWINNMNDNFVFYDPNTFGINLYSDPCTIINSNTVYRNYVKKNIICTGKWCVDNEYKCGTGSKRNCYEVEHIIDTNSPSFNQDENCKKIAGNLVMAWGKWNAALGGKYPDYPAIENEKNTVYGSKLVELVKEQIKLCNSNCF